MKKLSVIVPIYNCERTLKHCVDSIINQTFTNLEIILINDGSTDRSLELCNEYAQKDSRIIVLSQINQGASAARNLGMDKASGDYIAFVDADDYLDLTMYEKLINSIKENNSDVAFCHFNSINPLLYDAVVNKNYSRFMYGQKNPVMGCVWRMVLKKELISSLRYSSTIKFAEDIPFTLRIIEQATKVSVVDEVLYYYDVPVSTYERYMSRQNIKGIVEFKNSLYEFLSSVNLEEHANIICFQGYENLIRYGIYSNDKNLLKQLKNDKEYVSLNSRKNYKSYINLCMSKKDRIKAFLIHYKMFGVFKMVISLNTKGDK